MKCVVVLPTYNEAETIAPVLEAVLANGPAWHALVVDDASPDGTGRLVGELADGEARIDVLHRPGKLGLGTAYRDGLSRALELAADYVCTMDSDFSHDPAQLPRLRALAETHGAAHGSRYVAGGGTEHWGLLRKLNSALANILTRLAFGVGLRDCTSGFRCYRRDVLESLEPPTLRARGYAVLEELLYRCARLGVAPAEHPILFRDRAAGASKITLKESFAALGWLARLRLSRWRPRGARARPRFFRRKA
jgi:dolichol-phosphate mannosyltransferase